MRSSFFSGFVYAFGFVIGLVFFLIIQSMFSEGIQMQLNKT